MATVTVFTAARMTAIEDSAIVDGSVVGDNLILTTHDGTPIDAGNVRGPTGNTGNTGSTGLDAAFVVKAATTANVTQSGAQTIDGISLVAGDRVLCKDQTTASQNGIWVVAAGAWTRATDADAAAELAACIVRVQSGTANGGTRWVSSFKSTDTVATTSMVFYRDADGTNMTIITLGAISTDASGLVTVTHGLPWTPTAVFGMNAAPATTFPVLWGVDTIGATTFRCRFFNASAGGAANALSVSGQKLLCLR